MLVAITTDNQRITSFSYHEGTVLCPECGEELIYKNGTIRVPHFAHKSVSNCAFGNGESMQHLQMKVAVKNLFEMLTNPVVSEFEYMIGKYIADYYCELKYGEQIVKVAVECVYRHTTFEHFSDKSFYYSLKGIHQLWVFHDSLYKEYFEDNGATSVIKVNEMQKQVYQMNGQLLFNQNFYDSDEEWCEYFYVADLNFKKGIWRTHTYKVKTHGVSDNWVIVPTPKNVFLTSNRNLESDNMERRFETNDVAWKVMSQFNEIKSVFITKGANGEQDDKYNSVYRYDEIEGIYVMGFIPEYEGVAQKPKELICKIGEANSVAYKLAADDRFAMLKPGCQIKIKALDFGYDLYVYEESAEEWLLVKKEEPTKDPVTALEDYFASVE